MSLFRQVFSELKIVNIITWTHREKLHKTVQENVRPLDFLDKFSFLVCTTKTRQILCKKIV